MGGKISPYRPSYLEGTPYCTAGCRAAATNRIGLERLGESETDPHDFIKNINLPSYRRLKQAMAAEPKNESGWRPITSNALILAESGNLLMCHDHFNDGLPNLKP